MAIGALQIDVQHGQCAGGFLPQEVVYAMELAPTLRTLSLAIVELISDQLRMIAVDYSLTHDGCSIDCYTDMVIDRVYTGQLLGLKQLSCFVSRPWMEPATAGSHLTRYVDTTPWLRNRA